MRSRVRKAFLAAAYQAASVIGVGELRAALQTKDVLQVLAALSGAEEELARALRGGDFISALEETYTRAGRETALRVTNNVPAAASGFRFDLVNPRAVEFLRAYDGNLIRELSKETRQNLVQVVENGFKRGYGIREMTEEIMSVVNFGLTARQQKATWNYWQAQIEAGSSYTEAKKRRSIYEKRLLRYRAEMIARTETIRAAEQGKQESWRQAMDEDLLDPDTTRRVWIITPDDRLCDFCRGVKQLNAEGIPFNDHFRTPDGYFVGGPPAHPHCRCSTGLRFSND
jgi:hypothetical protein